MYIVKNALTSIARNKGRNILMVIVIMVIAATTAITLAIKNSANTLVEAYNQKYNIEASISFNREQLMKNFVPGENAEENIETFNDIEDVSLEEIQNYGNSDYVNYYYYTYSLGMDGKDLEPATDSLQKTTTSTTIQEAMPGRPGGFKNTTTKTEKIQNMKGLNGDFTIVGYSSYEGMSDFINGSYTISSGEVSSNFNDSSCVINEELATLNEIEIGDTITIVSTNDDLTYELTVTGIYTDNSNDSNNMKDMFSNSANTIITNINILEKMVSDDGDATPTITPTFILKSKDDIEGFTNEVSSKGLNENYQVTTNLSEIESETQSISNLSSYATTFLIITLIIGAIVLFIINMINIRERKYEIGVLRTIGMKKSGVSLQFTFELLIVTIIGLLLGATIGATSSVSIANKMLANEIASSEETKANINKNFGGMNELEKINNDENISTKISGITKISEVENINAVVNLKVLLELLGIGLLLTLFSSLASIISIAKFSPLTILKERS